MPLAGDTVSHQRAATLCSGAFGHAMHSPRCDKGAYGGLATLLAQRGDMPPHCALPGVEPGTSALGTIKRTAGTELSDGRLYMPGAPGIP